MNIVPWRLKRLYHPLMRQMVGRGRVSGQQFTISRPQLFQVDAGGSVHIGRGVHFEPGLRLHVRGELIIGDDVYVGKNATIVCFSRMTIGERTLIAENVSVHDEDHGGPGQRDAFISAPVSIGRDAWLCAGAVVTKGVTIGDEVTIGANAVVTRDIPTGFMGLGVPARPVKRRE